MRCDISTTFPPEGGPQYIPLYVLGPGGGGAMIFNMGYRTYLDLGGGGAMVYLNVG